MKKIFHFASLLVLIASFSMPLLASAQNVYCPNGTVVADSSLCPRVAGNINTTYLDFYYYLVLTIVNSYLVPILIAIAFIVFLWGAYRYFIWGAENEQEKAEGRKFAVWGIIGFVVIFSLWGLVNLVGGTIVPSGVSNTRPSYPTL